MTDSARNVVTTARLLVRPLEEADRHRVVELFRDKDFMAFYRGGTLSEQDATARFEHLVSVCRTIPFGKQAVVERASQNVCRKLGFGYWKQATVQGDLCNLYTLSLPGDAGPEQHERNG